MPSSSYNTTKGSCKYQCSAKCSCKYLHNRTEYDILQMKGKLGTLPVKGQEKKEDEESLQKQQGLHFDPDDSTYKIIGGISGGGWM